MLLKVLIDYYRNRRNRIPAKNTTKQVKQEIKKNYELAKSKCTKKRLNVLSDLKNETIIMT
jgi:phage terminase Nu1 subunit (DNA packaging protein)